MQTVSGYLKLWLGQSLVGSYGRGDAIAGLVGTIAAVVVHFQPKWAQTVNDTQWLVPLAAIATVAIFRLLFFVPYSLWSKEKARADALSKELSGPSWSGAIETLQYGGESPGLSATETGLILMCTVQNVGGKPSSVPGWWLSIQHLDGTIEQCRLFYYERFTVLSHGIQKTYFAEDLLSNKTLDAIPVGQHVTGWIVAHIPMQSAARFAKGTLMILKGKDAFGGEFEIRYSMSGIASDRVQYYPGMKQETVHQ